MRKICIMLLSVVLLSGCGGQKDSSAQATDRETRPEMATIAQNEINSETLVDRIRLELARNTQEDRANYLALLEQSAQMTITDFSEDGDTVTAQLTITAPDMYAIAKAIENETYTDPAALDADICQRLEQAETVTRQVEITFTGEDLQPLFTEAFADALYGGLMTYRQEYLAAQEVQ